MPDGKETNRRQVLLVRSDEGVWDLPSITIFNWLNNDYDYLSEVLMRLEDLIEERTGFFVDIDPANEFCSWHDLGGTFRVLMTTVNSLQENDQSWAWAGLDEILSGNISTKVAKRAIVNRAGVLSRNFEWLLWWLQNLKPELDAQILEAKL